MARQDALHETARPERLVVGVGRDDEQALVRADLEGRGPGGTGAPRPGENPWGPGGR